MGVIVSLSEAISTLFTFPSSNRRRNSLYLISSEAVLLVIMLLTKLMINSVTSVTARKMINVE